MPFGKYKDRPLSKVPRDYLIWVLRNIGIDAEIRKAGEMVLGYAVEKKVPQQQKRRPERVTLSLPV